MGKHIGKNSETSINDDSICLTFNDSRIKNIDEKAHKKLLRELNNRLHKEVDKYLSEINSEYIYCSKCRTKKLSTCFHSDRYRPNGKCIYCKECIKKRNK